MPVFILPPVFRSLDRFCTAPRTPIRTPCEHPCRLQVEFGRLRALETRLITKAWHTPPLVQTGVRRHTFPCVFWAWGCLSTNGCVALAHFLSVGHMRNHALTRPVNLHGICRRVIGCMSSLFISRGFKGHSNGHRQHNTAVARPPRGGSTRGGRRTRTARFCYVSDVLGRWVRVVLQ